MPHPQNKLEGIYLVLAALVFMMLGGFFIVLVALIHPNKPQECVTIIYSSGKTEELCGESITVDKTAITVHQPKGPGSEIIIPLHSINGQHDSFKRGF